MRKSSLGPFPKTLHWHQIAGGDRAASDEAIARVQAEFAALTKDPSAQKAITFLVALPVCTRQPDPFAALFTYYGIRLERPGGVEELEAALGAFVPEDSPVRRAAMRTLREFSSAQSGRDALFSADPMAVWRHADGPAFCDLARLFFSLLNEETFASELPGDLSRFAAEMAVITRSFSARWFNACARFQVPESGSIHWYLGHCLGKLDLELDRERSDWVEPAGNPWRRKKKPKLDLSLEL